MKDHTAVVDPGKRERAAEGVPVVAVFDGYRAFAIMAIAITHIIGISGVGAAVEETWADQLINGVGTFLVDILFIISGFVVFLPTVARGGEFGAIGAYAIRRAARLLPAFWLAMAIVLVVIAVSGERVAPFPHLDQIAVTFTGLDQIAPVFDHAYVQGLAIDTPIWTLSLEIGFYITLPLIASAYFRKPFAGLATAAAIAIGWHVLSVNIGDEALGFTLGGQLPAWAFSFASGMTGAWIFVRARSADAATSETWARRTLLAAVCGLVLCIYLTGRHAIGVPGVVAAIDSERDLPLNLAYTASLATAMVALALCPTTWQWPFANTPIRRLGDISYGVFLIHSVIIFTLVAEASLPIDGTLGAFLAWTAIVIPLSLLYGYASARFVEQPIRRWAHRYGRRAQVAAGTGGQRHAEAVPAARR